MRTNAEPRRASRSGWKWICCFLPAVAMVCFPGPLPAGEPVRTVNYYVDAALANNPTLASMKQRIAIKENETVRAGALADPKVWIVLVNVPINTWSFSDGFIAQSSGIRELRDSTLRMFESVEREANDR